MRRFIVLALAALWPTMAYAEPIFLNCTIPFQRKDGGTTERHFNISVDAADKTGHAREINPPYQLGGGSPTSPFFEPESVTFIMSRLGSVTEAIAVSRTDLSIVFLLGNGGGSLRQASLKGQCTKAAPPKRVF